MLIIYGLGNNENKYLKTKHNIGRVYVEELAKQLDLKFEKVKNLMVAKNKEITLVYSLDYMNTSGICLNEYIQFLKPKNFSLIIAQDDSDQLVENYKITIGGGSAGHNGINNIYNYLLSWNKSAHEIIRLKIGIRPALNKEKSVTFVLSPFTKDEYLIVQKLISITNNNLTFFEKLDIAKLQLIFNTK
jgi:peptidyl-tRNA hydrolase, PTH1 family